MWYGELERVSWAEAELVSSGSEHGVMLPQELYYSGAWC